MVVVVAFIHWQSDWPQFRTGLDICESASMNREPMIDCRVEPKAVWQICLPDW